MKNAYKILFIREASNYFQLGPQTLYCLAEAGKVPAKKVDNAWCFKKEDLCRWIVDSAFDRRTPKDRRQRIVNTPFHDKRLGKDRRIKGRGSDA